MGASKIMRFIQRRKAASLALSQGHDASAANDATPFVPSVPSDISCDGTKNTNEINVVLSVLSVPSPKSMVWESENAPVPPFVPSVPSEFSSEGTGNTNEINAVPPVPSVPSPKSMVWEKTRGNTGNTTPAVDWHQADRAYQAHHWSCPQCQASGKGYGSRCDEGQSLWDAYEAAPMPEFGKAKRVTPAPLPPAPQTPPRMTPRSGAEIVRMIGLHRRALAVGLPDNRDTDKAIDRMMDAPPDMACCFACGHLRGANPERWRCASTSPLNELSGLPLPRQFVIHLHRCPSHQPPPEATT